MKDLESTLRAALAEAEAHAPARRDLAERLIVGATSPGKVVAFRPARRWLPPLLAVAAVAVIVAGGVVAKTALSSSTPPAVHHSPPPVPSGAVPKGFEASDVQFTDAAHGWALGDAGGPQTPRVTVAATTDGGRTWHTLPAPRVQASASQCRTMGDGVAGAAKRCVDQFVFADADHGYAWGYHSFFTTTDGGRTWRFEKARPAEVVVAGRTVVRIVARGAMLGPAVVQVAAVGSSSWRTVTPSAGNTRTGGVAEESQLAVSGPVVYYYAPHSTSGGTLFRSADSGHTWAQAARNPCDTGFAWSVATAPDGTLALTCGTQHSTVVKVSTDGGRTFATARAVPDSAGGDVGRAAVTLPVSAQVLLTRVGNRSPGNTYYRSTNGGRTWQRVGQDDAVQSVFRWQLVDTRHGYRTQPYGAGLLLTSDGGRTWRPAAF